MKDKQIIKKWFNSKENKLLLSFKNSIDILNLKKNQKIMKIHLIM